MTCDSFANSKMNCVKQPLSRWDHRLDAGLLCEPVATPLKGICGKRRVSVSLFFGEQRAPVDCDAADVRLGQRAQQLPRLIASRRGELSQRPLQRGSRVSWTPGETTPWMRFAAGLLIRQRIECRRAAPRGRRPGSPHAQRAGRGAVQASRRFGRRQLRVRQQMRAQALGLGGERLAGPWPRPGTARRELGPLAAEPEAVLELSWGLLQDHVRVGAARSRTRRRPRGAGRSPAGQLTGCGQQLHLALRPIHVREGSSACRVLRQQPVAHRHHHLDHPGHAGGGLSVADVGLDRAEPQRSVGRAPARRSR